MFSATATSETTTSDLKPTQKPKPLPLINEEELEEDDNNNFFSRLLSKDTSMANPSFRVYYGSGAAGSVPFIWESQPGTPKHYVHSLFSESSLPPLTPPPSSFREKTLESNKPRRVHDEAPAANPSGFFRKLLKKVSLKKSSSGPLIMSDYRKQRRFSSRGSSFDSVFIADDVHEEEDHGSSYFCFQVGSKRGSTRW